MKKVLIAIAVILLLCNAQAATISISASNGNTVSVTHHYSADGDATYKAQGKGKVNYGSVNINEDFNASGKAEIADQGRGIVEFNHKIASNGYSIESKHETYSSGSGVRSEGGTISENGNINANDENGGISKDVSDSTQNGNIYDISCVTSGDWKAETYYRLYSGKLDGGQEVSTSSVHASQNLNVEAEVGNTYDFEAETYAKYDTNPDDEFVDMGADSYVYVTDTGSFSLNQLAKSGSAFAMQHFKQTNGTQTGDGNRYVWVYKDLNSSSGNYKEYAKAFIDWANNIEITQKATVENNVVAEQSVSAYSDNDYPWIYTYAYTDSDTDGNKEEYAKSWVEWFYPENPVSGTIYQLVETGSANTKMEGKLQGGIDRIYIDTSTDADDDGTCNDRAYVNVTNLANGEITFGGHGYADKNDKAYAELNADVKNLNNNGWNWYEEAYNNEGANTVTNSNSESGNKTVNLWADSSGPSVNGEP